WLKEANPDILCLQETKAQVTDVDLSLFTHLGYQVFWYSAQKKGYSGVAIFTKIKPLAEHYGNGFEQSDAEGRVIRLDFENFSLVNCYFPSGTSGDERQQYKYQWLTEIQLYLNELRQSQPNIVITGDYNIAHTEIDIHDPKGNKNSSGFLPEERNWFTQFLANGYTDTFRFINGDKKGAFSWWSMRFPSVRLQNKGWRIDYVCVTNTLQAALTNATILPEAKHSDHCPVAVTMQF
ncbi:MAG: exodeoxyribonuclease III, partial [Chitinophagaceae bacterium]